MDASARQRRCRGPLGEKSEHSAVRTSLLAHSRWVWRTWADAKQWLHLVCHLTEGQDGGPPEGSGAQDWLESHRGRHAEKGSVLTYRWKESVISKTSPVVTAFCMTFFHLQPFFWANYLLVSLFSHSLYCSTIVATLLLAQMHREI